MGPSTLNTVLEEEDEETGVNFEESKGGKSGELKGEKGGDVVNFKMIEDMTDAEINNFSY